MSDRTNNRYSKRIAFTLYLICFSFSVVSQNNPVIDSLKTALLKTSSDTVKLNLLNDLSEVLWRKADFTNSILYAEQALDLAKRVQWKTDIVFIKKSLAKSYNNIGSIYREKAEYENALKYHLLSAKISEEIAFAHPMDKENNKALALTYNYIGGINYFKGNYEKALFAYFKALPLFEIAGENKKLGSVYNNIGLIHEAKKDLDKAYEFYEKAFDIYERTGNKKGMANVLNNIGSVLSKKKDFDKALVFYFKAVRINEELGNKNWLAFNYENIGDLYAEKNELEKALDYHNKGLVIRKELNEVRGIANSYRSIAKVYFKKNDFIETKKNLLIALESVRNIAAKPEMIEVYLQLAECDSALGNYKSAFTYHQLYSQIKDSVFNEESNKQIAEMQTKYETEKKENENKLLINENKINALEISRQKVNRNNLIIGFSVVFVLLIVLYNRSRLVNKNKILFEKDQRNKAVLMAQEEEKGRLSKELHDGLGPLLSLIKLNASGVAVNSENERSIEEIKSLASEGMKEVRTISHALMPSLLQKNGLKAALLEFVQQINQTNQLAVELKYECSSTFSNEADVNIYRIIQEALNNAIKHSEASKILIYLTENKNEIDLIITDNGKGFDPDKVNNGNGLNNIMSRVDILKGNLKLNSKPMDGTSINISIPI